MAIQQLAKELVDLQPDVLVGGKADIRRILLNVCF
jgi:hypothetical protein